MLDYVFGRLLYNLIRGIWKGFYYSFVGITWLMWYIVYFGAKVLWYFLKYIYKACEIFFTRIYNFINNRIKRER